MKQEDINRVKELLEDYAKKHAPSHMRHLADEVNLQDLTTHHIKVCRVASQFDERHCQSVSKPYQGEQVDALTVHSVNVWDYEMQAIDNEFVEDEYTIAVPGSHHLEDCSTCNSKGYHTCPTCHGKTTVPCGCNHGQVTCQTCGGTGKVNCSHCKGGHVKCNSCGGTGKTDETCKECHGTGKVERWTWGEESYNHSLGGFKSEVRYRKVKKYYQTRCPSCDGHGHTNTGRCRHCGGHGYTDCTYCNGTGKLKCSTCNGKGDVVCSTCHGTGILTCSTCYGRKPEGTVICEDCLGSGIQHHYLSITQSLYYDDDQQILYSGDSFDQKVSHLPWQEEADSEDLLGVSADVLEGDIYPDDADVNKTLNQLAEQQALHANPDKQLLLQGAWVTCFNVEEFTYNYKEKDYYGIILGNNLYLDVSPVTEYIDRVANKNEKRIGGLGSAAALKNLEEAMKLGIGDQDKLRSLWNKAKAHLEDMVKLGEDLFFWLSLLFLTPLVYKFYAVINPVLDYASVVNDPSWKGYAILPLTQVILFIFFYSKARSFVRHRSKYKSTYGSHGVSYIIVGMVRMLLAAVAAFGGLLLLNYLGLSWLTTWAALIVAFLVGLAMWILMLLWKIIGWLWSIIVGIWNFIF